MTLRRSNRQFDAGGRRAERYEQRRERAFTFDGRELGDIPAGSASWHRFVSVYGLTPTEALERDPFWHPARSAGHE